MGVRTAGPCVCGVVKIFADHNKTIPSMELAKWCPECSRVLGAEYFPSKRGGLNNRCSPCLNEHVKVCYYLRKLHPYPADSRCQQCGTQARLDIDHSHDLVRAGRPMESFRNYLCRSCNVRRARSDALGRQEK